MEAKFRGQITAIGQEGDGDWVFGDLLTNKGLSYIVPEYADIEHMDEDVWEIQGLIPVHPDSVGMWTGDPDANGVDMYGGDIYHEGKRFWVVSWGSGMFMGDFANGTGRKFINFQDVVIIGNTTDNPELLKER